MKDNKGGLPPTHPGKLLREIVLPAIGESKTQVAEDLQISRNQLYNVLNEVSAVTPDLAVKLGKFCGNGPTLWLNMQARYDIYAANKRLRTVLQKIPERQAAA